MNEWHCVQWCYHFSDLMKISFESINEIRKHEWNLCISGAKCQDLYYFRLHLSISEITASRKFGFTTIRPRSFSKKSSIASTLWDNFVSMLAFKDRFGAIRLEIEHKQVAITRADVVWTSNSSVSGHSTIRQSAIVMNQSNWFTTVADCRSLRCQQKITDFAITPTGFGSAVCSFLKLDYSRRLTIL